MCSGRICVYLFLYYSVFTSAIVKLAPDDLHEIIVGVSSSQELMSRIAAQLQQALALTHQDGNENKNRQ